MYVPGLGTETLRAICLNFNYGVHSFLFHFFYLLLMLLLLLLLLLLLFEGC